jgi:hypothetical protein
MLIKKGSMRANIHADKRIAVVALIVFKSLLSMASNGLSIAPGQVYDLGFFAAESNQTATFILSNSSKNSLYIDRAESCCAYLDPVIYEKQIAPGTAIPLDVIIDANTLSGPFNKSITLTFEHSPAEAVELSVKGTALPAISIPENYIHVGHIPLQTAWSTNLMVTIRKDLPAKLSAEAQSNIGIIADTVATNILQISIPPQQEPSRWQGTVLLRIEGEPLLPTVPIHLEGYIGSSLQIVPSKVILSGKTTQATLSLFRKQPETFSPLHSPLQCSISTIGIEEEPGLHGKSILRLTLPESFIQRLKIEHRIPIRFSAKGYVPTVLMIEYTP